MKKTAIALTLLAGTFSVNADGFLTKIEFLRTEKHYNGTMAVIQQGGDIRLKDCAGLKELFEAQQNIRTGLNAALEARGDRATAATVGPTYETLGYNMGTLQRAADQISCNLSQ